MREFVWIYVFSTSFVHNVIVSTKNGEYALTRASYMGHTEVVEALLKANANVDVQNNVSF